MLILETYEEEFVMTPTLINFAVTTHTPSNF